MQRFIGAVLDLNGAPVNGVSVSVYQAGTQQLATIYSDNGITVRSNPFLNDSNGSFEFYAQNGRYDIRFSKTGQTFDDMEDVLLYDPGPGAPLPPTVRGLRGQPNPTTPSTRYDLQAWHVLLRHVDPANPQGVLVSATTTLTCDIAVQGANGRDQAAAFPSNSWIHLYYIWGGTLATLASLTGPPGTPNLPGGYTHFAYATTIRYGTSLADAVARGSRVRYRVPQQVLSSGNAQTTTAISIASQVPAESLEFDLQLQLGVTSGAGGAAASAAVLAPTTPISSGGVNEAHIESYVELANSTTRTRGYAVVTTVLSGGAPQLYYIHFPSGSVAALALSVWVQGYRVPNGDS